MTHHKRILIIGGGTAGASAALAARKNDRSAEITILDEESHPTYSRCGLPFAIHGLIQPMERLIVFPHHFFRNQKITYLNNIKVGEIKTGTKAVITEKNDTYDYDALVIATGAAPIKPPIPGVDFSNVFTLRTMADASKIIEWTKAASPGLAGRRASSGSVRSVALIGASFIGLEMAEALAAPNCDVTVVEAVRTLWRMVDEDVGNLVKQHLEQSGIKIIEQTRVERITGSEMIINRAGKSERLPAEMVICSAGVKPETALARAAGIEIGPTGGIKTNQYLQSNFPFIYSAGDCAEGSSAITGEPITIGLGTIAARQGVVAGINVTGGELKSPPILNSSVLRIFGLEIGSAGFTEAYLREKHHHLFSPVSALLKYPSRPRYYPGGTDIHIKLIADKKSRRVLGGQILGRTAVGSRVNTLAVAIQKEMTVDELTQSDFCYSPPLSDTWDPLAIAAQSLQRKMGNKTA